MTRHHPPFGIYLTQPDRSSLGTATNMPTRRARQLHEALPHPLVAWWSLFRASPRGLCRASLLSVTTDPSELGLLGLHRQTAFTFDDRGRMTCESAPDRSRGRRFSLAGCREGNLAVIRDDVSDPAARELELLVAQEPPLCLPESVPDHLESYLSVLDAEGSPVAPLFGLLWTFSGPVTYQRGVELVWSGTAQGDELMARFDHVVPASLASAGFRVPTDLWEPWCVAMEDGQVGSIAETVRKGTRGAEVGVDTAVGLRGHGLGAAATAGWSSHPELEQMSLFYSTARENMSSRRLTERLGLHFLGSTFAIT